MKEEGIGCAERCNAGEDMEACRREGVKKLVWPAARTLSLSRSLLLRLASFSSVVEGTGGTGEGEGASLTGRRNETLDNIRDLAFSFSLGPSSSAAFPLPFAAPWESTPDSSTIAAAFALDLVAVRRLCSRDERRRLNVLGWGSAGGSRDEDAAAEGSGTEVSTCFCDTIWCGFENVTLSLATAAAI